MDQSAAINRSGGRVFLVWFEDHREAVAIGPKLSRGAEDQTSIRIGELLERIS